MCCALRVLFAFEGKCQFHTIVENQGKRQQLEKTKRQRQLMLISLYFSK